MPEHAVYSLVFLVDETPDNLDNLKKQVAKILDRHGLSSDRELSQRNPRYLELSIRGSLEEVDACHSRLNDNFVSRYSCVRLRDEAGDEIRRRAYPTLAHIEQQLREFINRAMIEVRGFGWWDSTIPFLTERGIRDGVLEVEGKIKQASEIHHPLELTLFSHLIPIVTGLAQHWQTGKQLTAEDLLELLSNCSSLDELKQKLMERTRKISLWDEVFVRYFDDKDKWSKLAGVLVGDVIPMRNKVMHHRPMYRWQLKRLQGIEQEVDDVLASALVELPEEERVEARQLTEEWSLAWRSSLADDAIASLLKPQQEEWSRIIDRIALPTFDVGEAMTSFLQQQREEWSHIMHGIALPAIDVGEAMTSFLQQQQEEWSHMLDGITLPIPRFDAAVTSLVPWQLEEWSRIMDRITHSPFSYITRPYVDPLSEETEVSSTQHATQVAASSTACIGSTDSTRFHRPQCEHVNRILPENRVRFESKADALSQSYLACRTCKP